ncbi:MAG: elongation factor P maturation arginine rhamnosyltransferase EarP [Treponema sp.]|nr:elongation factor P maturation arginine rhamnosyltransferase EarP [Treponema sp.]
MNIAVLCKVVDNFGDIGVVWRLCCQLSNQIKKENFTSKINLIVDDLASFNKICNSVDSNKSFQIVDNINIFNWNDEKLCYDEFSKNDGENLSVILEVFQCGRPLWMEKILFEDKLNRTVQIIMIDYLTAEKYAEDFHCLQSLTRSSKVQKVNFMPGFTNKTGGLIIDSEWEHFCDYKNNKTLLCFTYDRNWDALANACKKSNYIEKVLIAPGKGFESLKKSFYSGFIKDSNLKIEELSFMNQNEWDKMLKNCGVLFIRGEESMSRACLSGIPFVWHAYPQSDEYQLIKVRALLERMSVHFKCEDFKIIEKVWILINSAEREVEQEEFEKAILDFFDNAEKLVYGFREFALDLRKNGDLCSNLMTFIKNKCIIVSNNRNLF